MILVLKFLSFLMKKIPKSSSFYSFLIIQVHPNEEEKGKKIYRAEWFLE
jgi:hypothetical protein